MTQFPVASWAMTYSASSPITDSAAAGTALSTGFKTRNGMVGMTPDSTGVESIAAILKRQGWGVGIATSVSPDDATPASFYAHVPARGMYYEIGRQGASAGYDILAGADMRGFTDQKGDSTDLKALFEENSVQIVRASGQSGYNLDLQGKVLLLAQKPWNNNDVGYTIDSVPDMLTLPQITRMCLSHLEQNSPEHFFLMVEGGNIDHALHGNDGPGAVIEIENFNRAIAVAYDFYLQHPDETLIVVTADHDTGGMALGNRTLKYAANIGVLEGVKQSKEGFQQYFKSLMNSRRNYTWADMKEYLAATFGLFGALPVTEKQEQELREAFEQAQAGRGTAKDQKTLYATFNNFTVKVFDVLNAVMGFGFTTTSHTGNPVPVFSIGVGAERFSGVNNNVDIPAVILDLAR